MQILPIFTEQDEGVYSIALDGSQQDVLTVLRDDWSNPEFVRNFFKKNKHLLDQPRYSDFTVNEASMKTLEDAIILFEQLENYARSGFESDYENLSDFFKPLHKNETNLPTYQASKTYGISIKDSWLRLYAIRLDVNCYLITGGGFKLVAAMQDDNYLTEQLNIIKETQQYLESMGVIYPEDLNTL